MVDSNEPLSALKEAADYTVKITRELGGMKFSDHPRAMVTVREFGKVIISSMELYHRKGVSIDVIIEGVWAMLLTMYQLGYEKGKEKEDQV